MIPDEEFENLMEAVGVLVRMAGPCPSVDQLVACHEGGLDPKVQKRVQEHVARCGFCDAILVKLNEAERIPLEPSWGWFRWTRGFNLQRRPLVAYAGYALALILLVPAYHSVAFGDRRAAPAVPPPPGRPAGPLKPEFSAISPRTV